ncbi:hypothetical protein BFF78_36310 [Streptomyces fodineus]|uniref:Uncharacterized protein n=1 Tax=Streptomyces fodineus TaxID=1904616 RepID=A0A1D7YKD4_9ACTN|nr:hypothetical protein BFF78_36310 [Streptomyces fodineus]
MREVRGRLGLEVIDQQVSIGPDIDEWFVALLGRDGGHAWAGHQDDVQTDLLDGRGFAMPPQARTWGRLQH